MEDILSVYSRSMVDNCANFILLRVGRVVFLIIELLGESIVGSVISSVSRSSAERSIESLSEESSYSRGIHAVGAGFLNIVVGILSSEDAAGHSGRSSLPLFGAISHCISVSIEGLLGGLGLIPLEIRVYQSSLHSLRLT